jgi:hypothetical protein
MCIRNYLILGLAGLAILVACKHEPLVPPAGVVTDGGGGGGGVDPDPIDTCDPQIAYFKQEVLPIFIQYCTMSGCHNTPTDDNDDVVLTSYQNITNDDWFDDIWDVLNEPLNDEDHMPPADMNQPTAAQLATIGDWLEQGAQNNSCESGCSLNNVTYSGTIRPIIQARCQGCHSGADPQGGLDFSTWPDLNAVAVDGRLAAAIQHLPGATAMPPNGPALSQCRIDQMLIWIGEGAPNN